MVASFVDSFAPNTSSGVGVQHWSEVVTGGTIHTMVSIGSNGVVAGVSSVMVPSGVSAMASQGTLTTVGAGTLTAALILDTDILRSGPTGAFTDTTDTAANIQSAWTGAGQGSSFVLTYQNTTAFNATLAAGVGVTLSGNTIVPANTWARYLVIWTGASAVTMYNIEAGQAAPLPPTQYVTNTAGSTGTLAAGQMEGSAYCVLGVSGGSTPTYTTRTAAQIIAGVPNWPVGGSYTLRVINTNSGTATLSAGSGVTITGTATLATNTSRDFLVTYTGAGAVTLQSIGTGTTS